LPRRRPSGLRSSSRSPWLRSRASEAKGTRAPGVINWISRIGRSAVARSIDCDPSRRQTPTELVGIEHGGGGATQSPGLERERRKKRARGKRPVGLTDATWSGSTR
jgi:hypothetical protein